MISSVFAMAGRRLGRIHLVATALLLLSGCATQLPAECPIEVPVRDFVLEPLTVDEQKYIKRYDGGNLLGKIALRDATLKSHVRVLEGVIRAHDSQLESCD